MRLYATPWQTRSKVPAAVYATISPAMADRIEREDPRPPSQTGARADPFGRVSHSRFRPPAPSFDVLPGANLDVRRAEIQIGVPAGMTHTALQRRTTSRGVHLQRMDAESGIPQAGGWAALPALLVLCAQYREPPVAAVCHDPAVCRRIVRGVADAATGNFLPCQASVIVKGRQVHWAVPGSRLRRESVAPSPAWQVGDTRGRDGRGARWLSAFW